MRDLHLSMSATFSPNGYDLELFIFCLPFTFRIEGKNQIDSKIYIQKSDCFPFFNDEEKIFIKKHIGKYVKKKIKLIHLNIFRILIINSGLAIIYILPLQ